MAEMIRQPRHDHREPQPDDGDQQRVTGVEPDRRGKVANPSSRIRGRKRGIRDFLSG
jgi:hypothetical protein